MQVLKIFMVSIKKNNNQVLMKTGQQEMEFNRFPYRALVHTWICLFFLPKKGIKDKTDKYS